MKTTQLEKIVLILPPSEWHGHSSETVWAEKVGDGRYRLRSVPFYAKGLSFGDVVSTRTRDGKEVVHGVSLHSGHPTYRAFVKAPVEIGSSDFDRAWRPIQELGATYERATDHLIAIDVPSSADLDAVYALLESGEAAGVWNFEEGHCERGSPTSQ
jgi:hypothetical protein